ncbi:putative strictosidine synthase [Rosa chinensis]|uniref:Putative strictosidine synthase n=1 Tax=Rosa chinensis TaxID=74649 RepID=A0A2P6RGI8_ROSCH|nr:putative strictosidine synthase [Rosa chinensis]
MAIDMGYNQMWDILNTNQGLLRIVKDGVVELPIDEAEGVKFKLTDCVDDFLEGRPYGRLLSYNPLTKETKVLVRNLYCANGVALSPDQNYVIFCETFMRRCRNYYLQSEKKGSIENFIDNFPGCPDNIRYDGEGHY